jgi:hypothetical protein
MVAPRRQVLLFRNGGRYFTNMTNRCQFCLIRIPDDFIVCDDAICIDGWADIVPIRGSDELWEVDVDDVEEAADAASSASV